MKKILTFMFATALLVSCQQKENETTVDTNNRIQITPMVTQETGVGFNNTDQIGVTVTQSNDFVYAANKLMAFNNGVFAGDLLWYPEENIKSQVVAYHPYDAAGTPTSFTVKTDQTDPTIGYAASDLIAASKSDVLPSANAILMSFNHMLTKLVFHIQNETQSTISSVVLKGTVPTATLNLGALSVATDKNATAADITAQAVIANKIYRAIVIPQTVAFTLEVTTADGPTLSKSLSTPVTLSQGGQYSVDVRVLSDKIFVTLNDQTENWTDDDKHEDAEVPLEEHLADNYFLYDGVKYKTVTFANGTTWMADPLIYLPKGYTPSTDPTADSHIWYPYEITDGATVAITEKGVIKELGYLYDLQAALGGKEITESNLDSFEGAQGICPRGWHIPTRMDYFKLVGKSNADADGKVPADGDKALFYDAAYDGAKIESLNKAGFNYQFSGVRMAVNFKSTPTYQKTLLDNTASTKTEWFGKPRLTFYMTSTAYKAIYNVSKELTNIQYFTLMSTFTLAKYPEGKLSLAYASVKSGMQLRCVRD